MGHLSWAVEQLAAAGIETPRLEAQLLLALALGVSRAEVVAETFPPPDGAQVEAFHRLVRERARRVPFAYLRGIQEFYGLPFSVTPAVLIPRPETEMLVEFALEQLDKAGTADSGPPPSLACFPASGPHDGTPLRAKAEPLDSPLDRNSGRRRPVLADIGTGSGCIVVAVLANRPAARAVALELSAEALRVADANAGRNGVRERVRFVRSSLLNGIAGAVIDVIVSNPPYIPTAQMPTLQAEVRDYEPRIALDGGLDGLDAHRGLARGALMALRTGGWLAVEVAMGQAGSVAELFERYGLTRIETRRDLAGIERLVAGQKGTGG